MVTNPEEDSSPEELLLGWYERDGFEIVRPSKEGKDGQSLIGEAHLKQLRDHLGTIHVRFAELYERDPEDLKFAMEIEFKVDRNGILVIKQARPWVF
jgi:hypothetical protein